MIKVPEYIRYHPLLPATGRHCRGGAPEAHRPDVGRLCHRGGAGRQREENPGISNSEHFSLKLSKIYVAEIITKALDAEID